MPFLFWGAVISVAVWAFVIPFTGGFGAAGLWQFVCAAGVSGVLHVLYMLVLQRGYRSGDLSTVYATARGSGPVLTVLVSVLLLGERPGLIALLGVALVVAGVTTFGLIGKLGTQAAAGVEGGGTEGGGSAAAKRRRYDPAILFGLLTGVAIAAYTLWDVSTVNALGLAPVAFMVGTSAAQAVIFGGMLGAQRARRFATNREVARREIGVGASLLAELRSNWKSLVAFGVMSPLSYILVLNATAMAPLSLVAPMRETSVVLVGLYGVIRYRESNPALRILAAVVVVGGVTLIGL